MKVRANREGFLTACQIASTVLPARSPKPVLRKILFEASGSDQGTLQATDLEQGIRYHVSGVTVHQPGKILLPTQEFVAILRELPDEEFDLAATESGMKISGSASHFSFPSEDPAEFPQLTEPKGGVSFSITAGILGNVIRRTVFAAATESSRYQLNSVLFEIEPNVGFRAVATDSKRLAYMPAKIEGSKGINETKSLLLPPKALTLMQKALLDPEEVVEVVIGNNEVLFKTAKMSLYTRLLEGKFPAWRTVIPGEQSIKVPVIVNQLNNAVRQAKIVTSAESKGVKFSFEHGQLTLRASGADVGESEIKMPVAFDRDLFEISFDPDLIVEMLRVLDSTEEIIIGMSDVKKAAVLLAGDDYKYVMMPVTRDN